MAVAEPCIPGIATMPTPTPPEPTPRSTIAELRALMAGVPVTAKRVTDIRPARVPEVASWLAGEAVTRQPAGTAWVWRQPAVLLEPRAGQHHTAFLAAMADPTSPLRQRLQAAGLGEAPLPSELLWMDIESTGLGDSTPLFLIGVMTCESDGLHLTQYLARSPTEEAAVLALFRETAERHPLLVSFNGKSFDLPYIAGRCRRFRQPEPTTAAHFDLLHEARASWRTQLPNCRLQTLERHLCQRQRVDDVPSREIPAEYWRFVATGTKGRMPQVLYHNQLDLLTLVELMLHLPAPPVKPSRRSRPAPSA